MSMEVVTDDCATVAQDIQFAIAAQTQQAALWHIREPESIDVDEALSGKELLRNLVLVNHLMNFRLWHVEDIARLKDVDASIIADCKYRIDDLNQRRTDAFEAVDAHLLRRLKNFLPVPPPVLSEGRRVRHNTESLGMAIDRLSILALKIFHMEEQGRREDVSQEHRLRCREKLAVLNEQRVDLALAVDDLVEDFRVGIKCPKAYYQFKMYNDPSLNPELYGKQ
ncbi:hypothetical protein FACS1894168_3630 [Deltaproteobacteria bacterium]|nr:hypothetical protein FACS1894168_3630 [Deltaproteobacteria bacterium]